MQKQDSIEYWSLPSVDVLQYFHTTPTGLTSEEAVSRLNNYGENSAKF